MIIYLDTCCYGRPFDKRAHMVQERVRREVSAIMDVVRVCGTAGFPIFGSAAVHAEIDDIGDYEKLERVRDFYKVINPINFLGEYAIWLLSST